MRQVKIVNNIQTPSVRSVNSLEPGTFFKDVSGNSGTSHHRGGELMLKIVPHSPAAKQVEAESVKPGTFFYGYVGDLWLAIESGKCVELHSWNVFPLNKFTEFVTPVEAELHVIPFNEVNRRG